MSSSSETPSCFSIFCETCRKDHIYPIPEGGFSADFVPPTSCGSEFPVFPSAEVTIEPSLYMQALDAVAGVRSVFFDGDHILLPETETDTIIMLLERFGGSVIYGQAQEYEFATRASKAGVHPKLVKLGHYLGDQIRLDIDEKIRLSLEHPRETLEAWQALDAQRTLH